MSRLSAMFSGFIIAYVLREIGVGGVFALITVAMIIVVGPCWSASARTCAAGRSMRK